MDEVDLDGADHAPARRRADLPAPASNRSESGPAGAARISELDGIRGLAAVAIVIFHARPDWLPLGWAAVDLFFGLSGFLITSIVLEHGNSAGFLRRFYLRRGLRIWPIYYLTILGFIILARRLPQPCDWTGFWYDLTYTQDLPLYWTSAAARFHGYLKHTWSLAIEEQFYLLWPVLILLCGARRVPLLAIGCAVLSALGRSFGWPASLLLTRLDGLALGGMLAALLHLGIVSRTQRSGGLFASAAVLGALSVVVLAVTRHMSCTELAVSGPGILAINLAGVGLIGLVVVHRQSAWLAPLRSGMLSYLGKISYGLYLYHYVILRISAGRLKLWAPWEMSAGRQVVTVFLCFLAASLSWALIEQPILRLKRRVEYQPLRHEESSGPLARGESSPHFHYHGDVRHSRQTFLRRALWRPHPEQEHEGSEARTSEREGR